MIKITNCEVCRKSDLIEVLNLGHHPLCDDLISIGSDRVCKAYPIEILLCRNCLTAHQKYQISKNILFPLDYHYRARFTNDVLMGMQNLVDDCEIILKDLNKLKVLDVGCNDGSLLNMFKAKGSFTSGVEPTNAAQDIIETDHKIYQNFFDTKLAEDIVREQGQFDIVVFTNVFAHIEDLKNLISATKKVLKTDGVLVIENHYLGSVLKKKQFDTFYHEHPRTYSALSFKYIADSLGYKITQMQFTSRYGGNIRVFLSKQENKDPDQLKNIFKNEKSEYEASFLRINNFIKMWKVNTIKKLEKYVKQDGPLVAKAFPGRAAILLNLLKLDVDIIKAVYEKPSSLKINHYVPGTRIPIKSEDEFFSSKIQPNYIVNLAWHISDEIREYCKEKKYLGKVIDILE